MTAPEASHMRRHDLVWIEPGSWRSHDADVLEPATRAAVQAWFDAGRPAIVCRQHASAPDRLCLGVPLPPRRGGARVALWVPPTAARAVQAPPALAQVIDSAPADWQPRLRCLVQGAQSLGISLSVYGSLLWQHLTGESYVHRRSDIDLLFCAPGPGQLLQAFNLLRDWERESQLRADGEVQLADGAAVAWRELSSAPARVLIKSVRDVQLRPTREILQRLSMAAA